MMISLYPKEYSHSENKKTFSVTAEKAMKPYTLHQFFLIDFVSLLNI